MIHMSRTGKEPNSPLTMAKALLNGDFVLVLLYGIAVVAAGERVEKKDGGDTDQKVILARCTSRCLSLHITQLSATFTNLQNDDILSWCGNKRRCSQCMHPCMSEWDVMSKQCMRKCEKRHECIASCEFLKSLQVMKQGRCPPPHRASGFAAACVLSCSADTDCSGSKKCCANGCGFTCQMPVNMFKGVPLKPHIEFIINEDLNRTTKVTWKSRFNISAEPVLYILQRRWNYGIQPSEDQSTQWQTITVTAAQHFIMADIRPGRWYQFRVAAVNTHGTQGFTIPSKHVHSTGDLLPPAAPTGLRKRTLTVGQDGTVSVNITWAVPSEHDLKIHHYRIWWNIRNTGELQSEREVDSWVLTDGAKTEFTLQDLLPDTEYLIKIQAVSYWGQKKMRSPKTQFILSTRQQDLKTRNTNRALNPCNQRGASVKNCKNVLRAFSFYHNNQLKIQIFWKQVSDNYVEGYTFLIKWRPVMCDDNDTSSGGKAVVKGMSYIFTGLQYGCTYKVTVRPFTLQGPLVEEVTFVKTPRCNNMKVKSLRDVQCPKQGRHRLSRSLINRSEKLRAVFQNVNGKITGEFHWQVLQSDPLIFVRSFLFSWAEMSHAAASYNTLTLPATHNFVIIDDLKPLTFYHVKVHTIALNGSSTEKTFLTPTSSVRFMSYAEN
ncbi:anosmin-1-like isoform X2 [Phyllobates terribilis]|uniref:anosmin-1-like isoform X2 n=1 Tax=Phyllobates terribilis TaxID=111132 RepID=UPI003CCAE347